MLALLFAAGGLARPASATAQIGPRQVTDTGFFYYHDESSARKDLHTNAGLELWESALASPNMTDRDTFQGFDITKPYLEQAELDGFTTLLRIVADFELEGYSVDGTDDPFTTITSVSIVAPDEIAADNGTGVPENIDPSWNLCFAYFYIDSALLPLSDGDENCEGTLSELCINDTKTWAAERFQEANSSCPETDDRFFGTLPGSCSEDVGSNQLLQFRDLDFDNFGYSYIFGNDTPAFGFSVGTGQNEEGDEDAYSNSGLRTILVATIWGYNVNDTSLVGQALGLGLPNVSVSCVRGRRGIAEGSRDPADSAAASFGPSLWTLSGLAMAIFALL